MKKLIVVSLLLSLATAVSYEASNVYRVGPQFPGSCGSSGQVLSSNGDCTTTWTAGTPSDTAYTDKDNNFSATQTFASSFTVISANGSAAAGMNAPNGASSLNINSGGNATVRILGGSSSILYVGEISGNRGLFDGAANPLFVDATNGNAVIGATSNSTAQLSIVGQSTDPFILKLSTTTTAGIYTVGVSSAGIVTLFGSGVPANSQALCLLAGQLGHCTSVVGAGGGCTCAAP